MKSKLVLVSLLLLASLTAGPLRAAPGPGAFPFDAPPPDRTVEVLEFRPPFRPEPTPRKLSALLRGRPTVWLYFLAGQPHLERAALELVQLARKWRRLRPILVTRVLSSKERDAVLRWVTNNGVEAPVVLDRDMSLAFGLQALRLPAYAVFDAQGRLRIRKLTGLDRRVADGRTLAEVLAAVDRGEPVPRSDGERIENTLTLIGQPAPALTFEPAPFGPAKHPFALKPERRAKPVLLVFWMATCPHCQKEMPRIAAWWRKHKDEIELVTATRTDQARLRQRTIAYLESRQLEDLPVYTATEEVFRRFKVEGIPTWAVVGTNGRIVAAMVGEDPSLERDLDHALAKARK